MAHINAEISLRPVRFAFLVRPDDERQVLTAIRLNTCLWGGKYNPIVPCIERMPKWWDRHDTRIDSPKRVINGYLDLFEPDFIVEVEPGLSEGLGFAPGRVLRADSILPAEIGDDGPTHGQSVFAIYRHLYHKVFQFERRRAHSIVNPAPGDPRFTGFCGALFGGFPEEAGHQYFARGFADAFDPKAVQLDADALAKLYDEGYECALDIGCAELKVRHPGFIGFKRDPVLFVMDPFKPRDLVDFWNLRASRETVVPAPLPWLGALSSHFRQFIQECHEPIGFPSSQVFRRTTVMFSRSVATDQIAGLYREHFAVDRVGVAALQDWYPPMWRNSPHRPTDAAPPRLTAKKRIVETASVGEATHLQFECLQPDFADDNGGHDRWANVVRLRNWARDGEFATAYPCDYRAPMLPYFGLPIHPEQYLSTAEGIVVFPWHRNSSEHWSIPGCASAIVQWFGSKGIKAVDSDAGRATRQIIKTLGGFREVSCIAHADVVELLNKMSRKPALKGMHHQEVRNRVGRALGADRLGFETLVERRAIDLGLELKCTRCGSLGWYPLSKFDHEITCGLCLRPFPFPAADPGTETSWAYRPAGPFALGDYANGGYAAALSIRFFATLFGSDHETTWSAGLDLYPAPKQKLEADFTVWRQERRFEGPDRPTDVIFGEAKSFGKDATQEDDGGARKIVPDIVEDKDVERMRTLATLFPGSILVFSTMKPMLSETEVSRLAKLAKWGRERDGDNRRSRAPVIILTGTELFAHPSLHRTWRDKGGLHARFSEEQAPHSGSLRVLADQTQQLYLGLPSYGEWCKEKIDRSIARRRAASREAGAGADATSSMDREAATRPGFGRPSASG
ncbi:MAG TPA: hypothetical protein VIF34_11370 [Methylocystis sp.]|jgi:hypothetical protein